jgi:peptidyl-prolyl cis-trans isomerase C
MSGACVYQQVRFINLIMKKGSITMSENLVFKRILMALPAVALLILTGCKENEANVPAPEPVDLTQTEDLFTAPIKPNPLTSDPDAVVVRVNGAEITRGEIMELMERAMQQFGGRVPPEQMQQLQGQLYTQIKNDLITKKLLAAAVEEAGIVVDEAKVEETIEELKGQLPEGQTIDDFLASRGMDFESFKTNLYGDLATQELLESKADGIADVSDEEAREFYDSNPEQFVRPETVSASHILMKTEADDTDEIKAEKKAKLEAVRESIIAGTVTFEDAATENSDCPSSARGGDLGSFGKGQMVPEFEVAAFSQEIGEVGSIVETQFGYHIIKVSEYQEEGAVEFEEVKENLIEYLTGQQKQQAVGDYLQSLRDSATIEEL